MPNVDNFKLLKKKFESLLQPLSRTKNTTHIHAYIPSDSNVDLSLMKNSNKPKQKLEFLTLTESFGFHS